MKPAFLSVLMLLLFSACGDSVTGPDASLTGTVTSASTGAPSYPATVALLESTGSFRFESVSNDGRYRFRNVKPGSYIVVLTLGQGAFVREALREPIEILPGPNVRDFTVP